MVTGEPRRATVLALTAVDCWRLDQDGFAQLRKEHPDIAREASAIAQARNASIAQRLMRAGAPPPHGDLLARILHFFSIAA